MKHAINLKDILDIYVAHHMTSSPLSGSAYDVCPGALAVDGNVSPASGCTSHQRCLHQRSLYQRLLTALVW